jgi:hypothetical protein
MDVPQHGQLSQADRPMSIRLHKLLDPSEPWGTAPYTSTSTLALRMAENAPNATFDNQARTVVAEAKFAMQLLHGGGRKSSANGPKAVPHP